MNDDPAFVGDEISVAVGAGVTRRATFASAIRTDP